MVCTFCDVGVRERFVDILCSRTSDIFASFELPFFKHIPPELHKELAKMCQVRQVPRNAIIVSQGDKGDEFYILGHGQVKNTLCFYDYGFAFTVFLKGNLLSPVSKQSVSFCKFS